MQDLMVFWVYRVRCLVNGKAYIGITNRTVEFRWKEHRGRARKNPRSRLHKAIAKYGPSNFEVDTLGNVLGLSAACEIERDLIRQFGTKEPSGYNVTDGGEAAPGWSVSEESARRRSNARKGFVFTEEHRQNISKAKMGHKQSPEQIAKRVAKIKGRKHKPRTPEQLERIRQAARARAKPSDETMQALRLLNTGRKRSPETCQAYSEAARVRWTNPSYRGKVTQAQRRRRCHTRGVQSEQG